MQIELSDRDIAQLLAALRNWQTDSLNEDDSVLCATCGRRYQLPSREEAC